MSRPQTKGRGRATREEKRHQADKFIFAIGPFLFVCSDAAPGICTSQMEEAAISREKNGGGGERGGREEEEAEGRGLGLFALKPQAEQYPLPSTTRQGPHSRKGWGRGWGEVGWGKERQRKFN